MGRADLHLHTSYSDGMATVPQLMDYVEHKTTLDVVAITDHDQIAGCYAALDWLDRYPGGRAQVVFGTEVTTRLGRHVLALFFRPPYPERPFRKFGPVMELAEAVQELGGVLVIPHPTSILVPSLGYRAISRLLTTDAPAAGLEVCNPSPGARGSAAKLRRFNDSWRLAEVGSSDAHHLHFIGGAYTTFPGRSVAHLHTALLEGITEAHWGVSGAVSAVEHARQFFLAMALKPIRDYRATSRARAAAVRNPSPPSSSIGALGALGTAHRGGRGPG